MWNRGPSQEVSTRLGTSTEETEKTTLLPRGRQEELAEALKE